MKSYNNSFKRIIQQTIWSLIYLRCRRGVVCLLFLCSFIAAQANSVTFSPGTIANNNSVVGADNDYLEIANIEEAGPGDGTCLNPEPRYQWQVSSDNTNWEDVPGATGCILQIFDFSESAYYRRNAVYVRGAASDLVFSTSSVFVEKASKSYSGDGAVKVSITEMVAKEAVNSTGTLNTANAYKMVTHQDAVGRVLQRINVGLSGIQTDVVQAYEYDELGRQSKHFLPYALSTNQSQNDGAYRPMAIAGGSSSELRQFYNDVNRSGLDAASDYPFAEERYEDGAFGGVVEAGSVGAEFQLGGGHTTKYERRSNYSSEVEFINYNIEEPFIELTGCSSIADLYVNKVVDPEGKVSYTYTNNLGQIVMKRTATTEGPVVNDEMITYYIYDDEGNLLIEAPEGAYKHFNEYIYDNIVFVDEDLELNTPVNSSSVYSISNSNSLTLGPGFSFEASSGNTLTVGFNLRSKLEDLITQYRYDSKNRLIAKRAPGAGWVYYAYDKLDRVVMTQDAEMRTKNQWGFIKYDVLGRAVYTGTYIPNLPLTREQVEKELVNSELFEQVEASSNIGYSQNVFPNGSQGTVDVLNITYYDGYNNLPNQVHNEFNRHGKGLVVPANALEVIKGGITCTASKILNTSNQYYYSAIFYNEKYLPVQIISVADQMSLRLTTAYSFTGNIETTHAQYDFIGKNSVEVNKTYEYDHAGRMVAINHAVGNAATIKTVAIEYDQLGKPLKEKLHSEDGINYLQEVDYLRDIQGRLKAINDVDATNSNDLFAMKLGYENTIAGLTTQADVRYDGNITGIVWKNRTQASTASETKHAYKYTYDKSGRFMKAGYSSGNNFNEHVGDFDVTVSGYDINGNILGIQRKGNGTLIDDLRYTYCGFKLLSVDDASGNVIGYNDRNKTNTEYTYNANGNMVSDKNKSISDVLYNVLNLPDVIQLEGGRMVEYKYTASGIKLGKIASENGIVRNDRYYFGECEYDGTGKLLQLKHAKGIISTENSAYEYNYAITDHLGNVRVMFAKSGTGIKEVQVNDYYPYGMRFNNAPRFQSVENEYLYSGKQLQSDFDLDWTDHHARFYDAALGRWHVQDPLSQFSNPYLAMNNNPISFYDLNGMYCNRCMLDVCRCKDLDGSGGYHEYDDDQNDMIGDSYLITIQDWEALFNSLERNKNYKVDAMFNGRFIVSDGENHSIYEPFGAFIGHYDSNKYFIEEKNDIYGYNVYDYVPLGVDKSSSPAEIVNLNDGDANGAGTDALSELVERNKDQPLMDLDFKFLRGYGAKGEIEVFGQKVMLGIHLATIEHSYNVVTGHKRTGYSGLEIGLGPFEVAAIYDYYTGFDFKFGLSAAKFSTISDPKMNIIGVGGYVGVGGSVGLEMNIGKYIYTVAPVYEAIYNSGGFTMGTFSDSMLKENISLIDSSLNKLIRLNGYNYVWIKDAPMNLEGKDIGVLAQEVEKIFPEAVLVDSITGYKKVYYYKLIPVMIEAIKEQQVIIGNQNALIVEYKERVKNNEDKLKHIINRLSDLEGKSR